MIEDYIKKRVKLSLEHIFFDFTKETSAKKSTCLLKFVHMQDFYPKRIVCLTEETTETLYLLGEQARIVGISGYTVRPPEARKEKPMVSAFIDARIDKILALKPDLVIGFSDIQADIAQELIKNGISVWVNNHRSVEGCMKMIVQLGSLVGKEYRAIQLVDAYQKRIDEIRKTALSWESRPSVYFEEWDEPMICGIEWVSELIELAGGHDVFKEKRSGGLAKDRIITDPALVIEKNPDIILASWCGKKFQQEELEARENWSKISAVANQQVFEIDSSVILQPGPAALTEGLEQLHTIFKSWTETKDN